MLRPIGDGLWVERKYRITTSVPIGTWVWGYIERLTHYISLREMVAHDVNARFSTLCILLQILIYTKSISGIGETAE